MSKAKPFTIEIDAEDWYQLYKRDEPNVSSEAAVLELVDKGKTSGQIAKYLIIAQELGDALNILQPAKSLVYTGAVHGVITIIHKQKTTLKIGEREINIPLYKAEGIGRPPLHDEDDELDTDVEWKPLGFIRTTEPEAGDHARDWLMKTCLGGVRNQLAIIRAAQGKNLMLDAAKALQDEIAGIVTDLAENGE